MIVRNRCGSWASHRAKRKRFVDLEGQDQPRDSGEFVHHAKDLGQHVERIHRKLGVETRTAAAIAWTAMRDS